MKFYFKITYQDKFRNYKESSIKAKDKTQAEQKWYKDNPYTLIKEIKVQ